MEKKQRTHKFYDKHTILGALVLMAIGLGVVQALGFVLGLLVSMATGNHNLGTGIGIAIISFLILWLYKFWFRPEFEGNLRGGDPKAGMKLALIFVVFWILTVPVSFYVSDATLGAPTVSSVFMAIMAGTSEEVAFRGLPISYLMRQWRDEKHILTAVLFTAGIFGVIHLSNITAGGNPVSVIMQTVSAIGIGIMLGAIYLRCGNLLVTIIIHTVHDIIAFLNVSGIQDGVLVGGFSPGDIIDTGAAIILGIIGLWLIRPAKRAEIRAIWDKKWSLNEAESESIG